MRSATLNRIDLNNSSRTNIQKAPTTRMTIDTNVIHRLLLQIDIRRIKSRTTTKIGYQTEKNLL